MNKVVRAVVCVVLVALLLLAFGYLNGLEDISDQRLGGQLPLQLKALMAALPDYVSLFALPLIWFYVRKLHLPHRSNLPCVIASVVIAGCMVGSCALASMHTFGILLSGPFYVVMTVISLAALFVLVYSVLSTGFAALTASCESRWRGVSSQRVNWKLPLLAGGIFLLAWAPYVVAFMPGSVCVDMDWQIAQFIGITYWSAHHAVLSTFIYGAVFSLGHALGGDNGGVMAITLMQTVAFALSFAFQIWVIAKLKAPRWVIVCAIVFFAIVPLFGVYCQWAVKDSLFAALFSVYVSSFILFVKNPFARRQIVALVVLLLSAVLIGSLRPNGFYIVLFSLVALAAYVLVVRKERKTEELDSTEQDKEGSAKGYKPWQIIASLGLAVVLIPCVTTACNSAVGAVPASVAEMLSLPFQQTARIAQLYPDEVQDWEREAIDGVLDYDSLAEQYQWWLADNVKGTFKREGSLSEYGAAWVSQGLRHPLEYLDAFGEMTYGYWSLQTHITYPESIAFFDQSQIGFDFSYWMPYSVRKDAISFITALQGFPLVEFFCQGGLYFWLMLIEAAYLLQQRKARYLIILMPAFVLFLTLLVGPVNGSIRYILPLAAVAPLMMWAVVFFANGTKPKEDEAAKSNNPTLFEVSQ